MHLRILSLCAAILLALQPSKAWSWPQEFLAMAVSQVPLEEIEDAWGLTPTNAKARWSQNGTLAVQLVQCSVPACIAWPLDRPSYTFQFTNLTGMPVRVAGHVRLVQYELTTTGDDVFALGMHRIATCGTVPILVEVDAKGWCNVTITPDLPERKGGYALIIDLDGQDSLFGAGTIRTFKPENQEPRQFYRLTMDLGEPEVLSRLGTTQNRIGISFKPPSDHDFEAWYQGITADLRRLRDAHLPVCAEFGGGSGAAMQPLGRPRPWLDDRNDMLKTKTDEAWLPSYDGQFTALVTRLASEYGWPKGPITAMKVWNEPWNGTSISGWGADDERYREIFGAMCVGVEAARAQAGVQVLTGGCDSSSNTFDKLFSDGSNRWLPRLDFLSIHYQGIDPHSMVKQFRDRKGPDGKPAPVLIWDTESWVANSDDRVAGVLASMFAFGQDRVVGIQSDNVVAAIRNLKVHTSTGIEPRRMHHVWSVGASVGAFQHFVGERPFKELLFRPGLPTAMLFTGSTVEDATVVVVGDLGAVFGVDQVPFRTCRSLAELAEKETLRAQLRALPSDSPERDAIIKRIATPQPFRDCRMTIPVNPHYALYDFYGNEVPAVGASITIPLDARGFYLHGDGTPGSAAVLIAAIRSGRIDGLAPVALQLVDAQAAIGSKPVFRVAMTNVLNRPVIATLSVSIAGLELRQAPAITVLPGASVEVPITVIGGAAHADNRYACRVVADFGPDGVVTHEEDVRVNLIAKRHITVDGTLDDWADVIPQPVSFSGQQTQTLTEKAWLPFVAADASVKKGMAVGWLAYDDANFYFAARINDTTPHDGAPRFSDTRFWDEVFYPDVSYALNPKDPTGQRNALTWPTGVRHYSYRCNPVLPCGNFPNFDNVQIAFNVLPVAAKKDYPFPPGTYQGFTAGPTTDYEYALNTVAARYGGGTEVWRLETPGMPSKHYFPRNPSSPGDGDVPGAQLVTSHHGATRIVECAIPWAELPEVAAAMRAGTPIRFSFRVNDDAGVGCMELARGRSISRRGRAFHADWVEHWENQLAFGWEK